MNEKEFDRGLGNIQTVVVQTPEDDEREIDLVQLVLGVLRDWKLLLLAMVVCALLGVAAGKTLSRFAATKSYTASTTVYVAKQDPAAYTRGEGAENLITGYMTNVNTKTYDPAQDFSALVKDSAVLQRVIDDLKLDMSVSALAGSIDTPLEKFIRMVRVDFKNGDPDRARAILERVVEVSTDSLAQMMGGDALVSGHTDITIEESVGGGMSAKKLALIGGFLGLFLMAVLSALLGVFDRRIKTARDVADCVDLLILAVIPQHEN